MPTPGPPVTTAIFDRRTIAIAARCDAANVLPVFFSTHGIALSASISGHGGAPSPQRKQAFGDAALGEIQPPQEDAGSPLDRVRHDLAALKLMGQGRVDDAGVDFEQRRRQLDQVLRRQAAMALVGRFLQGEGNAGAHPLRRLPRHAELHGDGVGGAKPDAADVAREPVRILGHDLDGVMAIGFEDADRPRRADAVGVQEEHDVADGLLLGPAGGDLSSAELADARDIPQLLGACLDDFECRHAEYGDDPLGELRADTAHHAGAEVFLDPLGRCWRRGLEEVRLELQPVRSVGDPDADGVDEFARRNRRGVADDWHKVALPPSLHFQDGETAVLVVERHPLDRADERVLGRSCIEGRFQRSKPKSGRPVIRLSRSVVLRPHLGIRDAIGRDGRTGKLSERRWNRHQLRSLAFALDRPIRCRAVRLKNFDFGPGGAIAALKHGVVAGNSNGGSVPSIRLV